MSAVEPIPWDAPGPYRVAFATRAGGTSDGPYDSLNLGLLTADEEERVLENRRRLCAAVGADPARATMSHQEHGSTVTRARPTGIVTPGAAYERRDGSWSDEPGQAMVLVTADCLPIALCRTGGERPALALLHAGWRGLVGGIVAEGARVLGGGPLAGAVGPGIGPCCYEVGEEVADAYRARFGPSVLRGRRLDLAGAAELALREAGCARVDIVRRCTACEPGSFFSHRRDAGVTGRQGVIGYVQ